MVNRDQRGSIGLLIALGVFVVLFVTAAVFAIWAYTSRQDYKDRSDQKSAAAVALAVKKEDAKKDADFVEKEKNPYRTYIGQEQFGQLTILYPKTWSALMNESRSGSTTLDGYMHPNFVPGLSSNTNFALRVQIIASSYSAVLNQFNASVKAGLVRVSPYVAPKVPNVTGARLEGKLSTSKNGVMVLLPMRDKTVKIWTESTAFYNDFNNIILANVTFTP